MPDGAAKRNGLMFGDHAAAKVIRERANDGLMTPIATTSPYTPLAVGPGGVAEDAGGVRARTNAVDGGRAAVHPGTAPTGLCLRRRRPCRASSGSTRSTRSSRSALRTAQPGPSGKRTRRLFYAANVNRQFNLLARNIATNENLDVPQTARLLAEVNEVGADAMISMMAAKYRYQLWRPVTAIDPSSVSNDGLGPVPGFDDGNPLTVELRAGGRCYQRRIIPSTPRRTARSRPRSAR